MQTQGFEYFAAGAFVFFLAIGSYAFFVFFLPEWVGLTGGVAKEAEKSHVGGPVEETNFWKRMDAEPMKGAKNPSSPFDENLKD